VKIVAAAVAVILIALAGVAVWWWEPWESDDEGQVDLSALSEDFQGSACREVAGVAAGLAEQDLSPTEYLRAFGRQIAGIRPPPRAYGDLARGGSNNVPGKGFLARFDDGTIGQARHFAGIAAAASFGGASSTRWVSIFVRRDPEDSPDGRLTDEGIAFASALTTGELETDEAPQWLLDHLCRRK
jgi:hypothetical protein